jgi:hypothetical protein
MSTLWNSKRGQELFKISLSGGLEDPDAIEFPTDDERRELINAQAELMENADAEQTGDLVTTATDFLSTRGTTVHEFSLEAIERVRGQMPIRSVRLNVAPDGETINITTANSNDETMEDYVNRVGAEDGSWDVAPIDILVELDDMADATSVSTDTFHVETGDYLYSTNTLYWPDGRSAEYDTSDIGFWVQEYLFVMNLMAVEQRLSGPQDSGA